MGFPRAAGEPCIVKPFNFGWFTRPAFLAGRSFSCCLPWNHDFQPSWLSIFDRKKNIPWEESSQDLFFHFSVSIIPTFHLGRNHISSFLRVLKESSVGIFRDPPKDIGRPLRAPIYSSLIPRTVKNRLRV